MILPVPGAAVFPSALRQTTLPQPHTSWPPFTRHLLLWVGNMVTLTLLLLPGSGPGESNWLAPALTFSQCLALCLTPTGCQSLMSSLSKPGSCCECSESVFPDEKQHGPARRWDLNVTTVRAAGPWEPLAFPSDAEGSRGRQMSSGSAFPMNRAPTSLDTPHREALWTLKSCSLGAWSSVDRDDQDIPRDSMGRNGRLLASIHWLTVTLDIPDFSLCR